MRKATKCFLETVGVVSVVLCGVGVLTYFAAFINFVAAMGILFVIFLASELLWAWSECCKEEEQNAVT
jgi:preprotein translocase subunit SecF